MQMASAAAAVANWNCHSALAHFGAALNVAHFNFNQCGMCPIACRTWCDVIDAVTRCDQQCSEIVFSFCRNLFPFKLARGNFLVRVASCRVCVVSRCVVSRCVALPVKLTSPSAATCLKLLSVNCTTRFT